MEQSCTGLKTKAAPKEYWLFVIILIDQIIVWSISET